jgi:hypothetical protein
VLDRGGCASRSASAGTVDWTAMRGRCYANRRLCGDPAETTQRRSEGLLGSHSSLRDEARVRSPASQVALTHQALLGPSSSTSISMCTAYPEAGLLHDRWCWLYGYPGRQWVSGYPASRRVVRFRLGCPVAAEACLYILIILYQRTSTPSTPTPQTAEGKAGKNNTGIADRG